MKNIHHSVSDILGLVPVHNNEVASPFPRDLLLQQFGKRLYLLRMNLGFSRKDLAEGTGLHYVYLGELERGKDNVSVLNLIKIASALQISLGYLLGGELADLQK